MRFGGIIIALFLAYVVVARAEVTYTVMSSADAFVATGSSNNPVGTDLTGFNYGGAGTLVVAPPTSLKGEFQSIIRFDLSGAAALFNSTYGSNWIISAV